MKLNRNILNKMITEAMTNLAYEDINPSNEVDGIESVENETKDNPLDDVVNHMFEPRVDTYNENRKRSFNKIRLTENQLNRVIKESVTRIIKEMNGIDFDSTNTILDKLNSLGEECNSLGLYDMAEDINEIIQKYNRF